MLDYLKEVATSLEDAGPEEAPLLMARAVEELGPKLLLVAADQRGSKILERLLSRGGAEAFAELFRPLAEATAELGPNQYGSHVLEAAFASWADRLDPAASPQGAAASAEGCAGPPPVEPFVAMCKSLDEDGAWPALISNACASHVVRQLLLALGGFVPESKGKGKAAARAGQLPERRHEVPEEIVACRRSVATALVAVLREDPELCLNTHASAAVQVLLRVLRERGERLLVAEAVAAIVNVDGEVGGRPSAEKFEALVRSAPGSRVLEVAVETASSEAFGALFSGVFRPRLRDLAVGAEGDFGPFLLQRVAEALREGPQLTLVLAALDVEALLGTESRPCQHVVVVKLLEACLRLNTGQKLLTAEVFKALNIRSAAEHPRAWAALLLVDREAEEPAALLAPPSERKEWWKEAETTSPAAADPEGAQPAAGGAGGAARAPRLKMLPAAGPDLVTTLLRFPSDAIEPLSSGLPKLLGQPAVLQALSTTSRTARVLEAALASTSALLPKTRLRLARAFKGLLRVLGPHAVGGWVVAAVWKAALGEPALREELAKELLEIEETLREHNWAVWKVCGLYQAKVKNEEWSQRQKKAGKTKALFDSLLGEGGAESAEAAKAAAATKKRRAEDSAYWEAEAQKKRAVREAAQADPLLAGLLGTQAAEGEEQPGGWRQQHNAAEDEERQLNEAEGLGGNAVDSEAAAREINELFNAVPKSQRATTSQRKAKKEAEVAAESTVSKQDAPAEKAPEPEDAALAQTLQQIAGGNEVMSKRATRKQKAKAKAAARAAAQQSSSSSEDEAPSQAACGKTGAGNAKKQRRDNFTR